MARKRPPSDEGGGYSWQDTYGDMVTLLLCFFVLLFAFSSVSDEKWNTLVEAFKSALSAMKIELDDEVCAKFVDKTITNAIYN